MAEIIGPEEILNLYRPSWDNTWLNVAFRISQRSRCSRAQIGAVIASEDNSQIFVGYNGPPAGMRVEGSCGHWCSRGSRALNAPPTENYDDCPSNHAEINALLHANPELIRGGTIYVTGAICMTCAKAVGNSGLRTVIHAINPTHRDRNSPAVEQYLRSCGMAVLQARYDTLGHPPRI